MSEKKESSMMMLARAIGGLNIMEPPEIPTNQPLLPRKFTKSKLKDIMEMSEMMAKTYENNTRALVAKLNGATAMMTASERLKLEFKRIEHESKMFDLEEMNTQAEVKINISRAETAFYEAKITKLDYLRRTKEAKEEGLDIEDEDRD